MMKFEIPPVDVSDLTPFSLTRNSCETQTAFAGVSKNGLWMWVVQDATISLYHTVNSEWFGDYCFAKSLNNPSAKIAAVAEFCSSHILFSCLLIAINHDGKSVICMYDINKSKVVQAVLVPDKVTCIEVISGNGGACMDTHHLFTQLRYMFGIVAVGTLSGHVYFLDLCLDEDFSCTENLPNITSVLKKFELFPERREKAIAEQQHIFMLLNDQSVHNGLFEFESRSSSLGHFPYGKVHVTALKYIPNAVSIAVGFNFGGIQLWDLQELCLLYTVANQPQEQPIISFAFQEPENDPRHFCYLWIIRGHTINERPEDFSVATMYSLVFNKRTYVESFGYLYTEMRNCFKRFEYRMTSDPFSAAQSSSAVGSCLLSCQTICQTDDSHCLDICSPNDSETASESMSLCFLSWTVWSHSENTPTSYHFSLFDLNQWYRAEMPSSNLRSQASDLNPYFAHFSLEEVAQMFYLEPILGLHVIPHSIKKFKYNTPSEEFFFPSALDFQTFVFSSIGTCRTSFMGLQKRLLYEISDMGPNILVNPKDIYSNLVRCGLVSDSHTSSDRVPLIVQRETLMQLALEYHMTPFFIKCLKEWRYADSIQEGCTSRAMLNWAWKKVIQIKSSIDKLTIPLFNCSDTGIDKGPLKCLYSYRSQLDLIDTIVMGYQKFVAPRTEQGIQELKCRKDVVFSINIYLQVMLWLRSVHVLPEVCEGDETEKNMLYPVNALLNSYLKRRSHLRKIHNSIGPTDILLIDGLIKEAFNENTWQEKGGNGIYPPPSMYAALSCYLLDDVPLELKHSLMYYLLLDICDAPQNKKNPMVSKVKSFPSVFGMSQSVSKLVQAFWFLDQFSFEVAIKKLLESGIKPSDILPWQHHRVIKSFLFQGEAQKALKYINHMEPPEITVEDMKLHLSVLLARGAIIQAFDYQRSKQSVGCGMELLNHLFLGCLETHKLKDLIYMPLNTFESSALVKFLSENEDSSAQETLVIYHLLRCNYFEAAKINEKLSSTTMEKSISRDRIAGRDALVDGLLASVPKMEKSLINEINRFPTIPVQKLEILKPLSLSIKSVPMKQVTYSDILNSLIAEASSAMCAPYLEPQTPLKSINKSSYENLPFLRPPLTPEPTKIPSDSIHSTPVTKRALTSPSSEFSSPSKRSRLLDSAPFRTSFSKKKVPKHLAGDVASLLQSPPIPRRTSKNIKDALAKNSPISAPQGILKKKAENTKFPSSDFFSARTPSVLSDAGEDSDSEDDDKDNEMNVDAEVALDANPGRQIRFSVPSNEELNASTYSNISTESGINNVFHEPSSLTKKLEELKPLPSLESADFHSKDFINVTHRKTLLTREPLKSHSKVPLERTLSSSENNQIVHEKSSIHESTSVVSKDSLHIRTIEPSVQSCPIEMSESDSSCSPTKHETENDNKIASIQSSSLMYSSSLSSVTKAIDQANPLTSFTNVESPFNNSGSSSGNSSYNSASERSFIITPRKPLRDNSRNTSISSNSMLSAQEGGKEQTLLGDVILEEMIIDDNTSDHSGGEEVSIIAEVSAPPLEQNIEPISQPMEEECICVEILEPEKSASQSPENICNLDFNTIPEEKNYGSTNKPYLSNEESLDIEQVFDSHDQHCSNDQLNVNQRLTSNTQHCEEIQNIFYHTDQFSDSHNPVSNDHIFNVNENPPDSALHNTENSSDVQNKIDDTEQCRDIQNQIIDANTFSNKHSQITDIEHFSCIQNQVTNIEYACDARNQDSDDVDAQTETVEAVKDDINEKILVEEIKEHSNIAVINEQFPESAENVAEVVLEQKNDKSDIDYERKLLIGSTETPVDESTESCSSEVFSFGKNVPISNAPEYIPIKERISRSHQSGSRSSKFDDDDDDEMYPSLLLQEQMDLEKFGEFHETDKVTLKHDSPSKSEKLDTIKESSKEDMETDFQSTVCSDESKPVSSTAANSTKDISQKLTERFEFLSQNSEFYENNKLHRKTMALLKSDVPLGFDIDIKKKPSRKTRTFVFKTENKKIETETISEELESKNTTSKELESKNTTSKELESKNTTSKELESKNVTSKELESKTGNECKTTSTENFFESWHPETYEQFASSIQKGRSNAGQKESLKSSPNIDQPESSLSIFTKGNETEQASFKGKGRKKQESIKDSLLDKKDRSSIKKAKGKGKTKKKMEFSFAEPHSPAGPEVLEALTTPSQYPVGSFMFSPPLTRGRLRQKRVDDTLGSSFASVSSETSFAKEKKPPVDPILQGIIDERAPETQKLTTPASKRKTKVSPKKKTASKKTEKTDLSQMELSDSSINTSLPIEIDSPAISKILSRQTIKHRMVLRQGKTKPRTEQLF